MPFVTEELYRNLVAADDPDAPISVHLTDFPAAREDLVDAGLDEAMEAARSLVSLGRTVRTDAKVRVRQPLPHAVVHVPGDPARLEPLLPLVAAELNVKEVLFAGSAEELAGWRAKPNYRVLGPKLGPRVKELASTLEADTGSIASALAAGEQVELTLPSGPVTIGSDDVELVQQTREGGALASEGPVAVALGLELTGGPGVEGGGRALGHYAQGLRRAARL